MILFNLNSTLQLIDVIWEPSVSATGRGQCWATFNALWNSGNIINRDADSESLCACVAAIKPVMEGMSPCLAIVKGRLLGLLGIFGGRGGGGEGRSTVLAMIACCYCHLIIVIPTNYLGFDINNVYQQWCTGDESSEPVQPRGDGFNPTPTAQKPIFRMHVMPLLALHSQFCPLTGSGAARLFTLPPAALLVAILVVGA